jgi:hypothetical protein
MNTRSCTPFVCKLQMNDPALSPMLTANLSGMDRGRSCELLLALRTLEPVSNVIGGNLSRVVSLLRRNLA